MNQQITIEVSQQVWQRASVLAERRNRKLEEVLEEWLEEAVAETRVEDLTDDEVLSLTGIVFDEGDQEKFSRLLEKNREGALEPEEKIELERLTRLYETGLLRKSQALRVAVERGLLAPLAE